MSGDFKLLGHGLDTVQFSLSVGVPEALSQQILSAQRVAKESHRPEPVELGAARIAGEILRHGGNGGDAMFSTGDLGEIWSFKTLARKNDPWGVTVKIRAHALLCYGLPQALERAWARARGMGTNAEGYSLGRVDYRFDVLTPAGFAPVDSCLIRPNRARVAPYDVLKRGHPLFNDIDSVECRRVLRGTTIETLMVGKIGSGQQLVLYNKRSEQIAKRDTILFEHYGLNLQDKSWGLWRIEVRFAGDVLKRRWNVRALPKLRESLHEMLSRALKRVRYVQDGQDHVPTPRRLLHPIWEQIQDAILTPACDQPAQFAPERAEAIIRAERERAREACIVGSALALAANQTTDEASLCELAPRLAQRVVSNALVANPEKASAALRRGRSPST